MSSKICINVYKYLVEKNTINLYIFIQVFIQMNSEKGIWSGWPHLD